MRFGFVDEHKNARPIRVMCRVLGVKVERALTRGGPGPRAAGRSRTAACSATSARPTACERRGLTRAPRVHAMLRAHGHRARPSSGGPPGPRRAGLRGLAARARAGCATGDGRHGHPIAHGQARPDLRGGGSEPGVARRSDLGARPARAGSTSPRSSSLAHPQDRRLGRCARRLARPGSRPRPSTPDRGPGQAMAIRRQRPAPGLICHSDRGVQHACEPRREALAAAEITPQVGRKGSCLGNAPMESFLHSLKSLPPPRRGSSASTSASTPPGPRRGATPDRVRGGLCSGGSRAGTTRAGCTRRWDAVHRPPWSAWQPDRVHRTRAGSISYQCSVVRRFADP